MDDLHDLPIDASYMDESLINMTLTDNYHRHTTTPTTTTLQQSYNNNSSYSQSLQQGQETIASITGSILLDFSTDEMNFSDEPSSAPIVEPVLNTFSTDSLDKSLPSFNKQNYTIAFDDADNNNTQQLPDLAFLNDYKPKLKKIDDWESLQVLLPNEYKDLKPLREREKFEDEKEADDSDVVKLRPKTISVDGVRKRFSVGEVRRRNQFKRYSLQEIEEIGELCGGISECLREFEGFLGATSSNKCGVSKVMPIVTKMTSVGVKMTPKVAVKKEPIHKERKVDTQISRKSVDSNRSVGDRKKKLKLPVGWDTTPLTSAISKLSRSGDKIYSNSPSGRVVLGEVCPSLYNLLSDGLLGSIDTIFGKVPNTVWRVVEASINCGPTTQTLAELVLRINSETELMAEGPLKFNAFICGLLNHSLLTPYLELLRTKEKLLRTHYAPTGYLYAVNTANRANYDYIIQQTAKMGHRFCLDIFWETKQLHQKIIKMKRSYSDERPKSVPNPKPTLPKSKTQQQISECKFTRLLGQWENFTNSKIPRPIKSPTRPVSAFVNAHAQHK